MDRDSVETDLIVIGANSVTDLKTGEMGDQDPVSTVLMMIVRP